jgi:hypothetical protein
MGAYEIIKDAIGLAQKIDNHEIINKLADAQQHVLDMQNEMFKLRDENKKLKDISAIEKKIVRHNLSTIVTLNDDKEEIFFCSSCWDVDRKLVQIIVGRNEEIICPNKNCGNKGLLTGTLLNKYRERLR